MGRHSQEYLERVREAQCLPHSDDYIAAGSIPSASAREAFGNVLAYDKETLQMIGSAVIGVADHIVDRTMTMVQRAGLAPLPAGSHRG